MARLGQLVTDHRPARTCDACHVVLLTDPHTLTLRRGRDDYGRLYDLREPLALSPCVRCADDADRAITDALEPILTRSAA